MKANELKCTDLRIGNYLKRNNKIVKVNALSRNEVKYTDNDKGETIYDIMFFHPIELTEELLLKIGFKKIFQSNITKGMFELNYDISDNEFINVICRLFEDGKLNLTIIERYGSMMGDNSLYKNGIKYLHQLQNAYYCLTGQELEIEL